MALRKGGVKGPVNDINKPHAPPLSRVSQPQQDRTSRRTPPFTMAVPKTMKAVVVVKVSTPTDDDDRDVALQEVPVPELLPGMYRVKSEAIALNPTDWYVRIWSTCIRHGVASLASSSPIYILYQTTYVRPGGLYFGATYRKSCYTKTILNGRTGAICGCDFAGTIVEIGPDVSGKFKIGDRVAGWQHGTCALNPQFGAFAEYVAGDEHGMWKIPDDVSFERAASSGVAVSTAGLGLFCHLGVPYPGGGGEKAQGDVLFYGGSTTVSQIGIQFAKRAGLRVIVTASPKNHEKLKSLGADVTIDYKDPDECIKQIREATGGKLKVPYIYTDPLLQCGGLADKCYYPN